MMRAIRSINYRDAPMLAGIAAALVRFYVLQRGCSLPGLLRRIDPGPRRRRAGQVEISRIIALTDALLRRIYKRSFCLPRSIVLFRLLRQSGLPVEITIGIAGSQESYRGHAWLELSGNPIGECSDPNGFYKKLYSYPGIQSIKPTE